MRGIVKMNTGILLNECRHLKPDEICTLPTLQCFVFVRLSTVMHYKRISDSESILLYFTSSCIWLEPEIMYQPRATTSNRDDTAVIQLETSTKTDAPIEKLVELTILIIHVFGVFNPHRLSFAKIKNTRNSHAYGTYWPSFQSLFFENMGVVLNNKGYQMIELFMLLQLIQVLTPGSNSINFYEDQKEVGVRKSFSHK